MSLVQFFKGQSRWKIALRAWGYALYMLANSLLTVALVIAVLLLSRT